MTKQAGFYFSAYRQGSTNGQRPFAFAIVTGVADKKEAAEMARKAIGAYKVLGSKLYKSVEEYKTEIAQLYKKEAIVIEM